MKAAFRALVEESVKANVTKVAVIKEVITSITSFIAANLVFSFPVTHLIVFRLFHQNRKSES